MSKHWQKVKLGDVLIRTARVESVSASEEYRLLGVRLDGQGPFLRETVSGTQTSATRLFRVAKGDFIYSRLFAWRGAFGVIGNELNGCYVSGEFPTFTPVPGKLEADFLKYWFRLPSTLARVEEDCSGSTPLTRNRFKENFFLALEIPLPPLFEQQRIVGRIEEVVGQIEDVRKLRQESTEATEALIISYHLQLAGQRKKRLGQFIQLVEDRVPIEPDGSYRQVGVKSFGAGLFPKAATSGTDTTYRTFNRLFEGALVLSQVKGWEGAVAVCPKDLAGWFVSPEYRTFRSIRGEASADYLATIVRTEWFWGGLTAATRGVGARRERTRPEQFLDIEIPMPDLHGQQRGEQMFSQVRKLRPLQNEAAKELAALIPALLDKAFKGEL